MIRAESTILWVIQLLISDHQRADHNPLLDMSINNHKVVKIRVGCPWVASWEVSPLRNDAKQDCFSKPASSDKISSVLLTMCHLNTGLSGGVTREKDQAEGQIAYSNYKAIFTSVLGIWESHLRISRHISYSICY